MKNSDFLVWRQRRHQDQFKISYECYCAPLLSNKQHSFKVGKIYSGRYYNGLYQVSADWGREETHHLSRSEFEAYFRLVNRPSEVYGT